jgi:hypothetical protein
MSSAASSRDAALGGGEVLGERCGEPGVALLHVVSERVDALARDRQTHAATVVGIGSAAD